MNEAIYSNGTSGMPIEAQQQIAARAAAPYDEDDQDELLRAEEQFAEDMQAGLSDDAPWKRIQQNTFTRWANEHLKIHNRQILDLQYDLSDGLLLIDLIEILSSKKLPKHNKRTTFRSQKLENVSVALDFLENVEQIRLVNIDASHIVDGRLKLILGLIWTLILHYYISLPRWELSPVEEQKPGRDPTPKQKLMGWVKNILPPDLPITNFTTDWNDGRAIGALVDSCAPGLYPDWVDNDPKHALKNTKDAMDLADQWLGIPQLIRPEEMIDPNVDDRSMMTYLSQYPGAKLKPGAPLRPRLNAGLVRCFGKGIEPVGNFVGEPTEFFAETKPAGVGRLSVILINPRGQQEKCDIQLQNDPGRTFTCRYTPSMEGQYKAIVKYAGQEVPNSPFSPYIDRHPADASSCRVYGPGVEGPLTVDKPTWFEVDHSDSGPGRLEGTVTDPIYHQETPISVLPVDVGKSRGEYTPRLEGPHTVNLSYDSQPIPGSPFVVDSLGPEQPTITFQAYGPGLRPSGLTVGDNAEFKVSSDEIPYPSPRASVQGPDGSDVPCLIHKLSNQSVACEYVPKQPGLHQVNITHDGEHVAQSPYNVNIAAPSLSSQQVRAHGPGLERGVVGKPAAFTVETSGNPEDLSFSIEGPDKVDLQCEDRHDGTVGVSYVPSGGGEHDIHVLNKGIDIPGSPFTAQIEPSQSFTPRSGQQPSSQSASRIRVYGPGVEPGLEVYSPTHFIVDCKEAGPGDVSVALNDPNGKDVELKIEAIDNAFRVGYTPVTPGLHAVTVLCADKEIPQSPIVVDVAPKARVDPSKIYVEDYNPNPVINQPSVVKMNTQQAGPVDVNDVRADILPAGKAPPAQVFPTKSGFGIQYKAPQPGAYQIRPSLSGVPLESVNVTAVSDGVKPNSVRVYGPGLSEGIVDRPAEFTVDTSEAGPGELRVAVEGPSKPILSRDEENEDSCRVTYTPTSPGEHIVSVLFDDQPVPGSPFHPLIKVHPERTLKAYGPGIDFNKAVSTGIQTDFTVDARPNDRRGDGEVRCAVLAGTQTVTGDVVNNKDGTYNVAYTPTSEGPLDVDVRYNGSPIPGSPFPVHSKRPSTVHCFGQGLESAFTGEPAVFSIDTSQSGPGNLNVTIHGPGDAPLEMKKKLEGLCVIEYVASRAGQYEIQVTFNDRPIRQSPFVVNVEDRVCESRVHVLLPEDPLHVDCPYEIAIDGRQAGPGLPSVSVVDPLGHTHSAMVKAADWGCYLSEFVPRHPGVHQFQVSWSGRPVPNSPFNRNVLANVFDINRVTVSGAGVMQRVPALVPTQFTIDTHGQHQPMQQSLGVYVCNSMDVQLDGVVVDDNHDGTYTVCYVPVETGSHSISVLCGSQHVPNSPFKVHVVPSGDANRCVINYSQSKVPIGERCVIHVDASNAGFGLVSATITNQFGQQVSFDLVDVEGGQYDIVFVPTMPGSYTIRILFGGQLVPNGTFAITAMDMNPIESHPPTTGSISRTQPIDFRLPVGGSIADVTAEIQTPSFRIVTPAIEETRDGLISIRYQPTECGEHILTVLYKGMQVQGSPYRFNVEQLSDGYVAAYGPGLSGGHSGEPCHFKIVTKDAGTGSLAVAVEGPSKAEIQCKDNKDGTCDATYWPAAPGDYIVTVKYSGKHISGSPFHVRIAEERICEGDLGNTQAHNVGSLLTPTNPKDNTDATDRGGSVIMNHHPVESPRSSTNIYPISPTKVVVNDSIMPDVNRPKQPRYMSLYESSDDEPTSQRHWPLNKRFAIGGRDSEDNDRLASDNHNISPSPTLSSRGTPIVPQKFPMLSEALSPSAMLYREGLAGIPHHIPKNTLHIHSEQSVDRMPANYDRYSLPTDDHPKISWLSPPNRCSPIDVKERVDAHKLCGDQRLNPLNRYNKYVRSARESEVDEEMVYKRASRNCHQAIPVSPSRAHHRLRNGALGDAPKSVILPDSTDGGESTKIFGDKLASPLVKSTVSNLGRSPSVIARISHEVPADRHNNPWTNGNPSLPSGQSASPVTKNDGVAESKTCRAEFANDRFIYESDDNPFQNILASSREFPVTPNSSQRFHSMPDDGSNSLDMSSHVATGGITASPDSIFKSMPTDSRAPLNSITHGSFTESNDVPIQQRDRTLSGANVITVDASSPHVQPGHSTVILNGTSVVSTELTEAGGNEDIPVSFESKKIEAPKEPLIKVCYDANDSQEGPYSCVKRDKSTNGYPGFVRTDELPLSFQETDEFEEHEKETNIYMSNLPSSAAAPARGSFDVWSKSPAAVSVVEANRVTNTPLVKLGYNNSNGKEIPQDSFSIQHLPTWSSHPNLFPNDCSHRKDAAIDMETNADFLSSGCHPQLNIDDCTQKLCEPTRATNQNSKDSSPCTPVSRLLLNQLSDALMDNDDTRRNVTGLTNIDERPNMPCANHSRLYIQDVGELQQGDVEHLSRTQSRDALAVSSFLCDKACSPIMLEGPSTILPGHPVVIRKLCSKTKAPLWIGPADSVRAKVTNKVHSIDLDDDSVDASTTRVGNANVRIGSTEEAQIEKFGELSTPPLTNICRFDDLPDPNHLGSLLSTSVIPLSSDESTDKVGAPKHLYDDRVHVGRRTTRVPSQDRGASGDDCRLPKREQSQRCLLANKRSSEPNKADRPTPIYEEISDNGVDYIAKAVLRSDSKLIDAERGEIDHISPSHIIPNLVNNHMELLSQWNSLKYSEQRINGIETICQTKRHRSSKHIRGHSDIHSFEKDCSKLNGSSHSSYSFSSSESNENINDGQKAIRGSSSDKPAAGNEYSSLKAAESVFPLEPSQAYQTRGHITRASATSNFCNSEVKLPLEGSAPHEARVVDSSHQDDLHQVLLCRSDSLENDRDLLGSLPFRSSHTAETLDHRVPPAVSPILAATKTNRLSTESHDRFTDTTIPTSHAHSSTASTVGSAIQEIPKSLMSIDSLAHNYRSPKNDVYSQENFLAIIDKSPRRRDSTDYPADDSNDHNNSLSDSGIITHYDHGTQPELHHAIDVSIRNSQNSTHEKILNTKVHPSAMAAYESPYAPLVKSSTDLTQPTGTPEPCPHTKFLRAATIDRMDNHMPNNSDDRLNLRSVDTKTESVPPVFTSTDSNLTLERCADSERACFNREQHDFHLNSSSNVVFRDKPDLERRLASDEAIKPTLRSSRAELDSNPFCSRDQTHASSSIAPVRDTSARSDTSCELATNVLEKTVNIEMDRRRSALEVATQSANDRLYEYICGFESFPSLVTRNISQSCDIIPNSTLDKHHEDNVSERISETLPHRNRRREYKSFKPFATNENLNCRSSSRVTRQLRTVVYKCFIRRHYSETRKSTGCNLSDSEKVLDAVDSKVHWRTPVNVLWPNHGDPYSNKELRIHLQQHQNEDSVTKHDSTSPRSVASELPIDPMAEDLVKGSGHQEPTQVNRRDSSLNVNHLASSSSQQRILGGDVCADASLVRVYGSGIEEGYVNVANDFVIDSRDAGNGSLAIAIEGPSKANIECPNNDDGTCFVSYKVTEPGRYLVSIKFAEVSVPGSPFSVDVFGPSVAPTRWHSSNDYLYRSLLVGDTLSQSLRMQQQSAASRVGSLCQLCIPVPGVSSRNLTAMVTSPSSQTYSCDVVDVDHQCKSIRFTPTESGLHYINVKHGAEHVAGSPYKFTVGPVEDGGAQCVRVSGPGLRGGMANAPCEFNVYTREAGAGALAITVEGPMNAEINFRDIQEGNGVVSYTCPGPGDYSVVVKFNDEHVPSSPFSVHIDPNPNDVIKRLVIDDAHQGSVNQSDRKYEINIPISFTVGSKNGLKPSSYVEAFVTGPLMRRERCQVEQEHGRRDQYRITFVPHEDGMHRVSVKSNGRELAGCPFEFNVKAVPHSTSEITTDASRVVAKGAGLYSGLVDQQCDFFVDTSRAGAGLLAVVVDGPSKVHLDCKETCGGYNVSFIANSPGDYSISIKFAGTTINGSPFVCRVCDSSGAASATRYHVQRIPGSIGSAVAGSAFSDTDRFAVSSDRSRVYSSTSSVRQHSSTYSSGGGRISAVPGNVSVSQGGWTYASGQMHASGGGIATTPMHGGASEPHRVRTYGSGIVKAKRNEQTEFTVDATDAGHNMLMVGILGPTRPCEEVLVKHVGQNVYTVSYVVREQGSYVLIVKWGDSHIPGSPFYIEVP